MFVYRLGRAAEAECGDTTSSRDTVAAVIGMKAVRTLLSALSEDCTWRLDLRASLDTCCVLLSDDRSAVYGFFGMRLGA